VNWRIGKDVSRDHGQRHSKKSRGRPAPDGETPAGPSKLWSNGVPAYSDCHIILSWQPYRPERQGNKTASRIPNPRSSNQGQKRSSAGSSQNYALTKKRERRINGHESGRTMNASLAREPQRPASATRYQPNSKSDEETKRKTTKAAEIGWNST